MRTMSSEPRRSPVLLSLSLLLLFAGTAPADYAWLSAAAQGGTLAERIAPPPGFRRISAPAGSFTAWLRGLPLHPGRPPVHLYDGRLKGNQEAHHAVVRLDVGARDLQQCADAVMRLRAEFLRDRGCDEDIAFRFTSGDRAAWTDWRRGLRPRIHGSQVTWRSAAAADGSYASFRRYLETVFTYAGSSSLSRELEKVADPARVAPGDVFVQGGFPGHAVLVADIAEDGRGRRAFLLLQSYMPAQEVHVLRNPADPASPWYPARSSGVLETPEWVFHHEDLRRFPAPRSCGS
ncbi:MAG TPA: DUF4846 domain-containing protein [Thermoanaerobaculia bacterium]|nr:DUF4846 domain-containing protein [Thermoanaerobaculia bacterium]